MLCGYSGLYLVQWTQEFHTDFNKINCQMTLKKTSPESPLIKY